MSEKQILCYSLDAQLILLHFLNLSDYNNLVIHKDDYIPTQELLNIIILYMNPIINTQNDGNQSYKKIFPAIK